MNEKSILGVVGGGMSPYALLSSLMVAAAKQDSQLTEEQKAERAETRRRLSEQRVRHAKIIQNICPGCEGKLVRGKKDKKNNYKRTWNCRDCGSSHSM
jgi:hypothetical protein